MEYISRMAEGIHGEGDTTTSKRMDDVRLVWYTEATVLDSGRSTMLRYLTNLYRHSTL